MTRCNKNHTKPSATYNLVSFLLRMAEIDHFAVIFTSVTQIICQYHLFQHITNFKTVTKLFPNWTNGRCYFLFLISSAFDICRIRYHWCLKFNKRSNYLKNSQKFFNMPYPSLYSKCKFYYPDQKVIIQQLTFK